MDLVAEVKKLVRNGNYRMTLHAEIERDADKISMAEIEEALGGDRCELIEDYQEDRRGHSFLLLGFIANGQPFHAVCSIHEETVVIITVYRPDFDLWIDWKIRRKR